MSLPTALFVFGIVVFSAWAVFVYRELARKRSREMAAMAALEGFRTVPGEMVAAHLDVLRTVWDPADGLLAKFQRIPELDRGHARKVRDLAYGRREAGDCLFFDYAYTTGHGKNRRRHTLTAIAFLLPAAYPATTIRPSNALDSVAAALGFTDFEVEFEDFNRRFHVSSEDPRFVSALLCPEVVEFLMARDLRAWHFVPGLFVVLMHGSIDPMKIGVVLSEMEELLSHVPAHLRADYGA